MFFILSKTLYYLVMPFTWIMVLFLLALRYRKQPRRRNRFLILSIVLFYIIGNRFLANTALQAWEYAPVAIEEIPAVEVGILLGGMTNQDVEGGTGPFYTGNVDRMIQAVHLYKEGKIQKLLVTGGTAREDTVGYKPEAVLLKQTLLEWGLPEEDIWLETASLNTYENALFSKVLLDSMGVSGSCILITSAFHMRRSVGCFKKQEIEVVPFPADFETISQGAKYPVDIFLPQEEAPPMWRRVFKETLGCIVYRLKGYL